MRSIVYGFFCVLLAGEALSQQRAEIVVVQETKPKDYFSIRLGAWFPKDFEKTFSYDSGTVEGAIDQSQAIGIDFHYRNKVMPQLFFDFSASGWYSSYSFKGTDIITKPELVKEADSWVAIAPFTIGLSFNPLPDTPVQPYLMAGLGAYVAITGRNYQLVSGTKYDDHDTYAAFGFFFGAGVDAFLSPTFGLSLGAKWQFIEYDQRMYTQQSDFTGLQVTLGVVSAL